MRLMPSLLTALATIAVFALVPQAQAGSLDRGTVVSPGGSEARVADVASDQLSARSRKKRMTTGAGSKVGGPNNARPTGTQAPDAQMGGSGRSGAR